MNIKLTIEYRWRSRHSANVTRLGKHLHNMLRETIQNSTVQKRHLHTYLIVQANQINHLLIQVKNIGKKSVKLKKDKYEKKEGVNCIEIPVSPAN